MEVNRKELPKVSTEKLFDPKILLQKNLNGILKSHGCDSHWEFSFSSQPVIYYYIEGLKGLVTGT